MIKKIKENIKEYKYQYILLIFVLVINLVRLDYQVNSPGGLIDLSDRIIVENAYETKGSINLTYVTSRPGSLLNIALSYIIPNWDLEKISDMRIDVEEEEDIIERGKISLRATSYDGIIAAFDLAGIEYEITGKSLNIYHIYENADTTLKVGDEILKIDNQSVSDLNEIHEILNKHKANDVIKILVKRNNKEREVEAKLQESDTGIIIGVALMEIKSINTTPKVEFVFKDSESGSSRGLMSAIDIYNKITEYDITKGRIIAGTGTIDEYGNVGEIGGVKHKLIGAVNNKADIFLVPKENYEEAIKEKNKHNYSIKIEKISTLEEAINVLKNN